MTITTYEIRESAGRFLVGHEDQNGEWWDADLDGFSSREEVERFLADLEAEQRGVTPPSRRNTEFYRDAFCSVSSWGPHEFERFMAETGTSAGDDPDQMFCHRAWRVWDALDEERRAEFARTYDYWLDA